MTEKMRRDEPPSGSPGKDFQESGDAARERKERWGDHEPGGASMVPGGSPETKREQRDTGS